MQAAPSEPPRVETAATEERTIPHRSAMGRRFGLLARLFAARVFAHVRIDPADTARIHDLAASGTVIYVMRYCSLVDYFLINFVLLREQLPLPRFANGVSTLWLRPVREILVLLWAGLRSAHLFGREIRRFRERDLAAQCVTHGRAVLLFIRGRGAAPKRGRRGRGTRGAVRGADYLRDIVHALWTRDQPVSLVPLAIFRGSGLKRKGSRFASFIYSVHEAPGDVKKLLTYWWNARDLTVSVGAEVPLNAFMRQYEREGEERIVRRLTRALQIFLYREERAVWGPALRSKRQVREMVLGAPALRALVQTLAHERNVPEEKVAREARAYIDEIAADFRGHYFAILAFFFHRIWDRMFSGLDVRGLERVVERLKHHPIVLVPCHRSHFDYLILSHIFHERCLSPPHIAAGINMKFWPLGAIFRGAGAYFIRRTFEGNPLYKMVFQKYLEYLIREGYTQEFFIEGGRSRTGKILTPKLGMLTALVNAYLEGVRRDLFLVPVSIHYGRIVEEEAYKDEQLGGQKERESFWGLLRARAVLRQKYGTVYVTFAEPISMRDALADRLELFRGGDDPATSEDKRHFVKKLGFRILREVNEVAVAGATSLSATVLLAAPHQAIRYQQFVAVARQLTDLLVSRGVTLTASLHRNRGTFLESLAFLQASKLIERITDRDGEIIYVTPEQRIVLDFYKNNIVHFFLVPSLVAHALRRGVPLDRLEREVWWWLDFFRWEFALPERKAVASEIASTLACYRRAGALRADGPEPRHVLLEFGDGILENFREAYWIAAKILLELEPAGATRKAAVTRMQRSFKMHLLLGQAVKPAGNSTVTFTNAINRFLELGGIELARGGRSGREELVVPGRGRDDLVAIEGRLGRSLITSVPPLPQPERLPLVAARD